MNDQELVNEIDGLTKRLNALLADASRRGLRTDVKVRRLGGILDGWHAVHVNIYRSLVADDRR